MELAYSYKPKNEETSVKAIIRDLNVSFKDGEVICDAIRGMPLLKAVSYLEEVIALKRPVPYRKYNKAIGHRPNLEKSCSGKYPKEVAKEMLIMLNNMISNAEYKGLNTDDLKITHIQALKGITRKGRKPKGRWKLWRTQLVHVQAVCEEK